ncbi:EstA protein [Coprinopsis sp. MPI-PUGE-AT-0042]|nr:EstA protein [Coprinopsis sp. MPI-PUGE-AT-0042]
MSSTMQFRCVKRQHHALNTTFEGIEHPLSTPEAPLHQFLGIKYALIPARFRQSQLCTTYPSTETIASQHGNCSLEFVDAPAQHLEYDEFECLNLNITCPSGLSGTSRLPVMLWIHGGGDRGAGSSWIYDGGSLVRKSILANTPVIVVTFNYRIGLLGFAASTALREDNKLAGDEGVGNYGLRDQQRCLEWLHRYISEFGGDPCNITLFGASSGAADIICHLLSKANQTQPMFARAIVQSAVFEPTIPDLSRMMSSLHCLGLGQSLRAVDDGVFFNEGWRSWFAHHECSEKKSHRTHSRKPSVPLGTPTTLSVPFRLPPRSRSRPAKSDLSTSRARPPHQEPHLQPLMIGDSISDSLLWSVPISLWTSPAVARRIKAICLSLTKANTVLRAYDISPYTPDDEITERVLELVNDSRVAWHAVWRYVFDQEGPARGIPHHAADLMYLFDTVPLPSMAISPSSEDGSEDGILDGPPLQEMWYDGPYDDSDDDGENGVDDIKLSPRYNTDLDWETAIVDEYSYAKVRDTIQEKWIKFAYGQVPWKEDKVFVFGPEAETGERSASIFEGRRRKHLWREALDPLGQAVVQKLGAELSRGPCAQ